MEETVLRLARAVDQKRYGKFRGFVADNRDPEKRARLRVRVPSVLGDQETDWALPCLPFGGATGYGTFFVPDVEAQVWVEFEEGDIHRPIWIGTFWQQESDTPPDAAKDEPTTRMLQTPGGHILQFDDASGEEQFRLHHPTDAEVVVDKDGGIALTDASGATVTLDANGETITIEDANGNTMVMSSSGTVVEDSNGNRIEMGSAGISVKGQQIVVEGNQVALGGQGGEPIIKGSSFLTLFATHIHPTAMGPSGPPVPQGEASALSMKVMTS